MDDQGNPQRLDAPGSGIESPAVTVFMSGFQPDDPLGDEAAFPLAWQHFAAHGPARD